MPIYEYRCPACEERFEELVRNPDVAVACPSCGTGEVTRLLSTFAGVGGDGSSAMPDYSRMGAGRTAGGCCGGACGHAH